MCIINGRKTGDNDGEFTYLCPSGASVIDYVISSYNLSNWISNFNVLSIDLSKHLPISCCLEIPVKQNVYSGSDNCVKQKRYKWVTKNAQRCKNMLCEVESLLILDNIVDLLENDVNEATNLLVTHLQNICEKSGLLCHNKQGGSLYVCKQPEWFDDECLILKHKKCKLLNDFRATSDVNILNEYIETKHNFQKLCDKKHKQYKVDKKIEICNVTKKW